MEAMLKLKIPASTANLGVGFDSIGMALNKYLHMNIKAIQGDNWEFNYFNEELESLPKDNLIIFIRSLKKLLINIMLSYQR